MNVTSAPPGGAIDIPVPDILRKVAAAPYRLPVLTVRNVVAQRAGLESLEPESIRVSASLYAALRDRTRLWARGQGQPEDPDLFPSVKLDRSVKHNVVRVEVSR